MPVKVKSLFHSAPLTTAFATSAIKGGPSRMSDIQQLNDTVNDKVEDRHDAPAWGAVAIGKIINRTPRQTFHLLSTGAIKSAQKKGGQWVATPSRLRAEFGG